MMCACAGRVTSCGVGVGVGVGVDGVGVWVCGCENTVTYSAGNGSQNYCGVFPHSKVMALFAYLRHPTATSK